MTAKEQWKIHNVYCTEIKTEMNKGLASFFFKITNPYEL